MKMHYFNLPLLNHFTNLRMLPESLHNILTAVNYPEFDLNILKLDATADPLRIECVIRDTESSNDQTKVLLTTYRWKDFHLNAGSLYTSNIQLKDNHPLLWEFTDTQCELYITAVAPEQVGKIAFDLLQIQNDVFGKYQLQDFLHLSILTQGYGLIKKGSKKLLTAFATSLQKNGVSANLIGDIEPSEENQLLKILFVGQSYFIAENFEFEIADEAPKIDS